MTLRVFAVSFAIPKSPIISACQCDARPGVLSPLIQLCAVALLCLAVHGTALAETCRNTSFEGAAYIACSFNPAKQDLRLFWRGADGKPYQTFGALARDLKGKGKSLRFAMNGGMYQDDFQPVGLYVENGRELTRANTRRSPVLRARYRTFSRSRTAFSTSATAQLASSRRDVFSPRGRRRISPRSPARCSSLTERSTRPSS
jgi:hypothetical protein